MNLRHAFNDGFNAAWSKYAAPITHPVVQGSALLGGKNPAPQINQDTPPVAVKQLFNAQEQIATKQDPDRKIAGETLCTTCRKPKHYGPCSKPTRTPPAGVPLERRANFNAGLYGDNRDQGTSEGPSMSPHYTAGTVADSGGARARPGNPLAQARSTHQDFFRPSFQNQVADESTNVSGGLIKNQSFRAPSLRNWESLVAAYLKTASGIAWGPFEQRGPTVNPYEQFMVRRSPPVAQGPVGDQAITHAFDQIDCAVDSTNIEGGGPSGGPAVLG